MRNTDHTAKNIQPLLIAFFVFVFLASAAIIYTDYKQGQWEKDVRSNLTDILISKKSALEKALYSRIYYTRGVSAYVAMNPDITNGEYHELAKEYIKNDTVISTMALSKNGIISAIYPVVGHEAAIGLNLLEHPERKEIVEKTIETGLTFVAGPVELVEGGIAFISYTPIFDKTQGENTFWGVTDIVIKQSSLLNEANLNPLENDNYFTLQGFNGLGKDGAVFWGVKEILDNNPVKIDINLPIGNWVLAAAPRNGWKQYQDQDKILTSILFISAFVISLLAGLFSRALFKIKQNERDLKAIFASLDSLIIELDDKGRYLKIASENERFLALPKEQIIGKKLHDVFDQQKADFFLSAIKKCLDTKELVIIEYPLTIDAKKHWFTARLSYKALNRIIFNAYDTTEKKEKEDLLEKTGQQLKELNEMKDKFISVLAHDLRSPVAGQKALNNLILDEYDNLDDTKRKEMLATLNDSTENLFNLLENLLEWSKSQTGKTMVSKEKINFGQEFSPLISEYRLSAKQKNIALNNGIDFNEFVIADKHLTRTILRNLISNAIKFTHEGGTVSISTEIIHELNSTFLKINISDNGIGMNEEKIQSLFKPEKAYSTSGTANEQGTGLGLLLCKEFTELQGGKLWMKSSVNQGSTFSFTIPVQKQ
jgi:PAS domain S-box-containing protein